MLLLLLLTCGLFCTSIFNQWYVVFLNKDNDHESTTLTYSVKFDASNFAISLGFLLTIGGIFVGGLIGLITAVLIIRKRHNRIKINEDF